MEYAIALTFITTAILGRFLIPVLKKLKLGQIVRDDGPKSHLVKMGIPTMGGIMFIIPIIIISLIICKFNIDILIMVGTILLFTFVGFLDDIIKIKRKSKDGLSVLQKTIGLLIVSVIFSVYFVYFSNGGSDIILPFSNMNHIYTIPKLLYVIILIITLYATTNSVNLTDGVDGLASSVTAMVILFLSIITFITNSNITIAVIGVSAIGGIMAFLLYNGHPAKVFMGDTGSLALGSIVALMAIYLKIPWVIIIVGIIYVIEALSVIIQVGHYKRTKRRVFKMAPIHHHFELSGWNEKKVVTIFTIITVIACIISYAILFLL